MIKGSDWVSNDRTTSDDAAEPEVRSREAVAREIGATPKATDPGESHRQDLEEGGPLRLDKSGALAGRPKLKPVKAHRKADAAPAVEDASAVDEEPAVETQAETQAEAQEQARPTSRPRKAVLPPKLGRLRPEGAAAARAEAVEEISIPAGSFLYGESRKSREVPAFRIDRRPVTNADYETFVTATGHRRPLYWPAEGLAKELAEHPVVGVDYYDALAYARWKGKDLPYEDEWERAARSTDGRTYPWGNDQELSGANTARVGLKMTVPFDLHRENVSPDGCLDMVGNAWEITHSPAPGGGVVVRGGSWYDFALYAKTFFRFASQPDARNGTIGFRCCRREDDRSDAPREVDEALVDAEIAARRASEAPADASEWSAERRDLVVDLPRLRTFVAEARAEALLGAAAPKPSRPVLRTIDAPPAEEPEPAPAPEPEAAPEPARTPEPEPEQEPVAEEKEHDSGIVVPPPSDEPPAEAPRIHIGGSTPGMTRPLPDKPKATPPKPRATSQRSMPVAMWVLLAAGFLLFGGLLVVLVNRGEEPSPIEEDEAYLLEEDLVPRSPLAELPDMPAYDDFPWAGDPARVIDVADRAAADTLDAGAWVLIFVDPDATEAPQTLQAAHALHRRLDTHGVKVAVVLPRTRYVDEQGALLDIDALHVRLETDGSRLEGGNRLWDGIRVVLEPQDGNGRGLVRLRTMTDPDAPVAAVLLRGGLLSMRSSPPEGGYDEASLVGLAKRALDDED